MTKRLLPNFCRTLYLFQASLKILLCSFNLILPGKLYFNSLEEYMLSIRRQKQPQFQTVRFEIFEVVLMIADAEDKKDV